MLLIYISMLDSDEDKHIFIELHDEYSQLMYRIAYGILRDSSLAEDAVQRKFYKDIKKF